MRAAFRTVPLRDQEPSGTPPPPLRARRGYPPHGCTGQPDTGPGPDNPDDPAGFTRPQPIRVTPAPGRHRYTGPLAVLTGGETYSAGETLTQALMQRPAFTVRAGQNTQGVFSDILTRTLPNGWTSGLPDEEYLTPSGTTFDGPGIPPDIRTGDFVHDIGRGTPDSAFAQALTALRTHDRRPPTPTNPRPEAAGTGPPDPDTVAVGC
ncbi:S41 family peptidase [Streptomyces collinus]